MDAALQNIKQGSNRSAVTRTVMVLFFCVLVAISESQGQQLAIKARDKNQELVHDLVKNEQIFKEVQWDVHNSFKNQGVAVIWTAAAFEAGGSSRSGKALADTGLTVRIVSSGPKDSWRIVEGKDITDVVRGDTSAMVSAISNQNSQATFGLIVTFRNSAVAVPVAGQYQTLLTGTITAL